MYLAHVLMKGCTEAEAIPFETEEAREAFCADMEMDPDATGFYCIDGVNFIFRVRPSAIASITIVKGQ